LANDNLLHACLRAQRERILDNSAMAEATDYSLSQWVALTRYLDNAAIPM
jgi:hypothetical protein